MSNPDPRARRSIIFILSYLILLSSAHAGEAPIHPSGIAGSLILCGNGDVPERAIEQFTNLAKRGEAKIVVISMTAKPKSMTSPVVKQLQESAKSEEAKSFQHFLHQEKKSVEIIAALKQATGAWVDGDAELLKKSSLLKALQSLISRGAVLGCSGNGLSSLVASSGLLPDAIVSTSEDAKKELAAALKMSPTAVGYQVPKDTALVVRQRRLGYFGEGPITLHFAPSKTWPDISITLNARHRLEDLTAMRRFARQRHQPLFPPKKPAAPIVEKGTLIIVGGGGMPKGLFKRFVEEAGGKNASIVIIPISMPDPLPRRDRLAELLKSYGAKKVTTLVGRTPEAVEKPESLEALRTATGIWFGGGRQWRFIDAYEGTKAAQLMHEVLARGGVIAGSSAGASIQGEYMARGNPLGSRDIMANGYERGLCFLKGVAIDQHFSQRRRFRDLSSLIRRYPQLLGIGIDEATALIVKKNIAEVVGRTRVCFYDAARKAEKGSPDYQSVPAGEIYDLVARKVVKKKPEKESSK